MESVAGFLILTLACSSSDDRARQRGDRASTAAAAAAAAATATDAGQSDSRCPGCGRHRHRNGSQACPAHSQECRQCGKRDHFARVCRSRPPRTSLAVLRALGAPNTNQLGHQGMLYCPLLLSAPNQSAKCDFLVDTGAEVSTLRSSYVKKWFPEEPLRPSDLKLGGFDAQHVIQPDGALPLQAQFLGQAPGVVTFQVVPDSSQTVWASATWNYSAS